MLTYLQYLFGGVFLTELGIYYYYQGREQTLLFDIMDIQHFRLSVMLAAGICIFICELMKDVP